MAHVFRRDDPIKIPTSWYVRQTTAKRKDAASMAAPSISLNSGLVFVTRFRQVRRLLRQVNRRLAGLAPHLVQRWLA
jgi:hypothetical protein